MMKTNDFEHPGPEELWDESQWQSDLGNAWFTYLSLDTSKLCFMVVPSKRGHRWKHWNGRFWEDDWAETYVKDLVGDCLLERSRGAYLRRNDKLIKSCNPDSRKITGCLKILQSFLDVESRSFDVKDQLRLAVANGMIDLETGKLSPHDPRNKNSYALSVPYLLDDKETEAGKRVWERYITTWFAKGKDDHRVRREGQEAFFKRWMGYCITGSVKAEKVLWIVSPIRAGKGCIFETIGELLRGTPLWRNPRYTSFTKDANRFAFGHHDKSRALIIREADSEERLNGELIKALSGGGAREAEEKYMTAKDYHIGFKLVFQNQSLPSIPEAAADVHSRIDVIRLYNSWIGEEDLELKTSLCQPHILQGVLLWLVEGAKEALADGLQPEPENTQYFERAKRLSETCSEWFKERVDTSNPNVFESFHRLYLDYVSWCQQGGLNHEAEGDWRAKMEVRFPKVVRKKVDGRKVKCALGWSLKSAEGPSDSERVLHLRFS